MSQPRRSGRLCKRPRLKYIDSDDQDLDEELDESTEKDLTSDNPSDSEESSDGSDEEFNLKGPKVSSSRLLLHAPPSHI